MGGRLLAELGEIVKQVSLGLNALGIERGDKVGILSNTRPEWTYSDFAISARRNGRADLPDELARGVPLRAGPLRVEAVILEDAGQLEKIRKVRDQLPKPRARDLDGAA